MNGKTANADVAGMLRSCQNAIKVCYSVEDLGDPRGAPPSVPSGQRAVTSRHKAVAAAEAKVGMWDRRSAAKL